MAGKTQTVAASPSRRAPGARTAQRRCTCGRPIVAAGECEDCRRKRLAALDAGRQPETQPAGIPEAAKSGLRSSGQPLDARTRRYMEERFHQDFSEVRVHADGEAARSAQALRARAYTVGQHIGFADREYHPETMRGRELLAHELAHTVQQRSGSGATPVDRPDSAQERSATAAARAVSAGQPVRVSLPSCGIGLSRSPVPPEEWPDTEIASRIAELEQRTKAQNYPERERDLESLHRLRYVLGTRLKALQPPPAPVPLPPPPKTPREIAAEREAVAAEAEAIALRPTDTSDDDEPDTKKKKKPFVPSVPKTLSLLGEEEDSRQQQQAAREIAEQLDQKMNAMRIDTEIADDRQISKASFQDRIDLVRMRLQKSSDDFGSRQIVYRKMTAEQIWSYGRRNGLFTSNEEKAVKEDQAELQGRLEEYRKEENERIKQKALQERDDRVIGGMKRITSVQAGVQTPLVVAVGGPVVGGLYLSGTTGYMVGNAYNQCSNGTSDECADALVPVIATAASAGMTKSVLSEPTVPGLPPVRTGPVGAGLPTRASPGLTARVSAGMRAFVLSTKLRMSQPQSGPSPTPVGPSGGSTPTGGGGAAGSPGGSVAGANPVVGSMNRGTWLGNWIRSRVLAPAIRGADMAEVLPNHNPGSNVGGGRPVPVLVDSTNATPRPGTPTTVPTTANATAPTAATPTTATAAATPSTPSTPTNAAQPSTIPAFPRVNLTGNAGYVAPNATPTTAPTAAPTTAVTAGQAATVGAVMAHPEGAHVVQVSAQEYAARLSMVDAQQYENVVLRAVEMAGNVAAAVLVSPTNPNSARFIQACRNRNWTLAGTLFHSEAARQIRAIAPMAGVTITAEDTVQAGRGGSRLDVTAIDAAGNHYDIDWKTTGRGALTSRSRAELARHAQQYQANRGAPLNYQLSKSWVDFVRALIQGVNWPK